MTIDCELKLQRLLTDQESDFVQWIVCREAELKEKSDSHKNYLKAK